MEIRTGSVIECEIKKTPSSFGLNKLNHNYSSTQTKESTKRTKDEEPIFDVKYSGFTNEAKAAFQYAVDIWEKNLKSDVKIKVFANWSFVDNLSTLAFVTPTEVKNFDNAPVKNMWYPITLAEKLARKDLNPTAEADIVATFNNRRTDWYFGLDGNCPPDKLDLVTVVLHELGHGLGFAGTLRVNGFNGFYGLGDGNPKIYDTYLRNSFNKPLLEFQNGSLELAGQITSNSVAFNSPIALLLSDTPVNPRVYAPNPYAPGSSIAHLDEGTYEDTPNSLMTPFASYGKVAHDPGPLVRGIFYEMGWLNTFIDHNTLVDRESNVNIPFSVIISQDTAIIESSVSLHYSFDNFSTESVVQLTNSGNGVFASNITLPQIDKELSYFFTVKDILNRSFRLPIAPTDYFSFFVGTDVVSPSITHDPQEFVLPIDESLIIEASVTDNIGIQKVSIEYKLNESGEIQILTATAKGNDLYEVSIDLLNMGIVSGDIIHYRIIAVDNSSSENSRVEPETGFFQVPVKIFESTILYTDDFTQDLSNFFGDFSISKPTGFTDNAIHSPHPYPTSNEPGTSIDLLYTLLVPIIVDSENTSMTFDEVVLIEPGTGTDYNNPLFKDYVIVEATKSGIKEWIPIIDGYDSRSASKWIDYYNGQISNGNSNAIGTLNYFINRRIDLQDYFSPGDEILIRFRLHSDDAGRGWGWAIDNLVIQEEIVSIEDIIETKKYLFPNPAHSILRSGLESITTLSVYTMGGQLVATLKKNNVGDVFNINSLDSGIYIIRYNLNGKATHEKLVIAR